MDSAKVHIGSITMPAGEYYVGDPCYAVPDDRWMEWLKAADYTSGDKYLLATLDGAPVLGIGTAYGDGAYEGSPEGYTYGVDSGLIGLVPVELAKEPVHDCLRVSFPKPFECSYSHGHIILGHIDIDTDPDDPAYN